MKKQEKDGNLPSFLLHIPFPFAIFSGIIAKNSAAAPVLRPPLRNLSTGEERSYGT